VTITHGPREKQLGPSSDLPDSVQESSLPRQFSEPIEALRICLLSVALEHVLPE
jgi:hypothetical protein